VDPRALAKQHALGRIAIGTALTGAPRLAARPWIGGAASAPGTQVVGAAMGARDVAIGLGALRALRARRGARPWIQAAVLADTVDLLATLRSRDDLPALGVAAVSAMAAGSAALGLWLQQRLRDRPA
jgi:hypothetical protein